jgi:hypothetical protein
LTEILQSNTNLSDRIAACLHYHLEVGMKLINSDLVCYIFILAICLLIFNACAADQGTPFTVKNQTAQAVILSVNGDSFDGDIKPGEKKSFISGAIPPAEAPWAPDKYLFEAKTKDGQVVFSHEYTRAELENLKYEIVIQPK